VLPFFWLPGHALDERENRDKVPYQLWAKQGFINVESDKTVDYERIAVQILECLSDYDIQGFGFDRWRINDLKVALKAVGLENLVDEDKRFFPIGQGFKDFSPCVEALERALLDVKIAHGNHPILTWNASNAVSVSDPAGNRKLDKSKSYGRIDGVVALAMALRVPELLAQVDVRPSAFESEACLM